MDPTSNRWRSAALVAACLASSGCGDEWGELYENRDHDGDPFFTALEWERIEGLAGMPEEVPAEPSNAWADNPAAAELGRKLFFDEGYSPAEIPVGDTMKPGTCNSCHPTDSWYALPDEPASGKDITSVLNIAHYEPHTWNGKRDTLWGLALTPAEGFMKSNRFAIARYIATDYLEEYQAVFGHDEDAGYFDIVDSFPTGVDVDSEYITGKDPIAELVRYAEEDLALDVTALEQVFANFGKALSAYMRQCNTGASRFDDYVLVDPTVGDEDADRWGTFSDAQKRGLRLFVGRANCIACHNGPLFTDNRFHDVAVPETGKPDGRDEGLAALDKWTFRADSEYSDDPSASLAIPAPTEVDRGAYRTASLRNIAETGPYMHGGQYETLRDVLDHYFDPPASEDGLRDAEIWALEELTEADKDDLEAFLYTLTANEPFAGKWTQNPFGDAPEKSD